MQPNLLVPVYSSTEIFPHYRNTPIERLLKYHNLGYALPKETEAELLIGMCMDNRNALRMPSNFAFVIRTAGGNMRDNEFRIAYAIAVGDVKAIAVIGHTECGMSGLARRGRRFVRGMVENAGWNAERAERFFAESAPKFEIGDVVEFIVGEAERLRSAYPKILVAPLLYKVENELLYLIREKSVEVPHL